MLQVRSEAIRRTPRWLSVIDEFMNNVRKLRVEVMEDQPQLHVVVNPNGAAKKPSPPVPLMLPARIHIRRVRPELAALGWNMRAARLERGK
jgi:hypothetical protein